MINHLGFRRNASNGFRLENINVIVVRIVIHIGVDIDIVVVVVVDIGGCACSEIVMHVFVDDGSGLIEAIVFCEFGVIGSTALITANGELGCCALQCCCLLRSIELIVERGEQTRGERRIGRRHGCLDEIAERCGLDAAVRAGRFNGSLGVGFFRQTQLRREQSVDVAAAAAEAADDNRLSVVRLEIRCVLFVFFVGIE